MVQSPSRLSRSLRLDRPRRASITPWVLVVMLALLCVMVVMLEQHRAITAKVEMQNSADAAALAAGRALVNDQLLTGNTGVLTEVLKQAIENSARFAEFNSVFGKPVILASAGTADSDIVLGRLETPGDRHFCVVNPGDYLPPSDYLLVNAVRITARRTGAKGDAASGDQGVTYGTLTTKVKATATVILDRDVVGFQARANCSVPLVPIALLSDPTGTHRDSWQYQVEKGHVSDKHRFHSPTQTFLRGTDGLHEMTVRLDEAVPRGPKTKGQALPKANGRVLRIGVDSWNGMTAQVSRGIAPWEMNNLPGGQILLEKNENLTGTSVLATQTPKGISALPTQDFWRVPVFTGPANSLDGGELNQGLRKLARSAEPRIWPLFSGIDPRTGEAFITGFVAARVVEVDSQDQEGPSIFAIQPCMMCTAAAVTDAIRHRSGEVGNRYLCRIRLVE